MKIKIKFSFVILIVVFIAICFGNNSLAAEVESVNANYKNGKVTVSGKANCSRVAIRIIDEEGTVKGLSNASVLDKTFSKTINTGNLEEGKKYIVKVNNIVGGEESATTRSKSNWYFFKCFKQENKKRRKFYFDSNN